MACHKQSEELCIKLVTEVSSLAIENHQKRRFSCINLIVLV